MRTLVIGDIHGGLKGVVQLLKNIKLTESDTLIFLGDYVDGWSESAQVIQFLIELSKKNKCIFIKGNHDSWCEEWLSSGTLNATWLNHGGKSTIASYHNFSKDEKLKHLSFFKAMKLFHIDNANRLFVHAGFTSVHGVEHESVKENFYFDRTLWELVISMDKNIKKDSVLYPKRLKHYSEIYLGHTPTINYNSTQPIHAINIWGIDTGAAFTGPLSAIDVDTKIIYQSENLTDLYPDELGRNKT